MQDFGSFLSMINPLVVSSFALLVVVILLVIRLVVGVVTNLRIFSQLLLTPLDNKWYVQLIGSFFVVALAFAANNWIVYLLSVVIVATLVTETGFLLWVLTLLGNRKEVAKTMVGVEDQEQVPSPVDIAEVTRLVQQLEDQGKRLEEAENQNKYSLLTEYFYDTYVRIFGSQIEMLRMLESIPQQKATRAVMERFFRSTPWVNQATFVSYTNFLLIRELIGYDPLTDTYNLTDIGRTFLQFWMSKGLNSLSKFPF